MTTADTESFSEPPATNGLPVTQEPGTLEPRRSAGSEESVSVDSTSVGSDARPRTRPAPAALPPSRRLTVRQGVKLAAITLAITVLGAAVALGVSLLLPPEYAARTELIYFDDSEQPTGFLREDRTLTTQIDLITSRRVLGPVAAASGLSVPQLAGKVDAKLLKGSLIIVIEVRDGDRDNGVRLARAISDRYQEVIRPTDQPGVRAYLERELADLRTQLSSTSPDAITARAALRERQTELQSQLDELQLKVLGPLPTQVSVPPYSIEEPVFPRPVIATATGALTGLMIALGLVAFMGRRWTRG